MKHNGAELFGGIARGEAEALASLYQAAAPRVYAMALRILRDEADAEETTIDVFLHAWRHPGRFDPTRGNPQTWLITLARSRALDRLRARTRRQAVEGASHPLLDPVSDPVSDPAPDPEQVSLEDERRRQVQVALGQLEPREREVIEQSFFAGASHHEISRALDLPLGTVKSRIRVGMQRMRRLLCEGSNLGMRHDHVPHAKI